MAMESKIRELNDLYSSAVSEYERSKKQCEAFQAEKLSLTKDLERERERISKSENELKYMHGRDEMHEERMKTLETDMLKFEDAIEREKRSKEAAKKNVAEMQEQLSDAEKRIKDLTNRNDEHVQKAAHYRNEMDNLESIKAELMNQVKNSNSDNLLLERTSRDQQSKLDTLQQRVLQLERELANAKDRACVTEKTLDQVATAQGKEKDELVSQINRLKYTSSQMEEKYREEVKITSMDALDAKRQRAEQEEEHRKEKKILLESNNELQEKIAELENERRKDENDHRCTMQALEEVRSQVMQKQRAYCFQNKSKKR